MKRAIVAVLLALASSASASPPTTDANGNIFYANGRFGLHWSGRAGGATATPNATPAANTHIIFINKCTGGCTVHPGTPDNRTDTSDIANTTSQLSQFNQSATVWNQVKSCMVDTFSRFNVTITDVDPGQTAHLEIMVAGTGSQMGLPQGVLGIADFPCQSIGSCDSFMPNALVFAYANDPYYTGDPDNICSTIAQEIAHTWSLDHVVDPSDPMTYNNYSGIRQYKDNQACGSDCQGGQSPFGLTCSGSGGNATHICAGTGTATQDEVSEITALFGSSAPDTTPPTVVINSPANGASVMPGFGVTATVTDDQAVASAELKIDGQSIGTLSAAPFAWNAPSTLTQGSHHVEVVGTDDAGNTASAAVDVTYGHACVHNSDCSDPTQVCDNGHCVAGPTSPGGLGSPCMANSDCASNECADDGQGHKYCVENCDPTMQKCPGGFGCVSTGPSMGVCWPGADNGGGGGGCDTSSGGTGGVLLMGLALGALVITRRRRS